MFIPGCVCINWSFLSLPSGIIAAAPPLGRTGFLQAFHIQVLSRCDNGIHLHRPASSVQNSALMTELSWTNYKILSELSTAPTYLMGFNLLAVSNSISAVWHSQGLFLIKWWQKYLRFFSETFHWCSHGNIITCTSTKPRSVISRSAQRCHIFKDYYR